MSEVLNPTLPDDIVADILLRLPVKPIGRFKCVSKPWRSLLSNPQFVRAHLKFHNDDPEDLILTPSWVSSSAYTPYIVTLSAGSSPDDGVAKKVQFLPSELNVWSTVAGSCHGLVLLSLQDAEGSLILFNPVTAKVITLEAPAEALPFLAICSHGVGYDSLSDDYKIVCLSQPFRSSGISVDVYSVGLKCWKRINADSPYFLEASCYDGEFAPGVYLNGCIHWLGFDTRNGFLTLLCYDLARDELEDGIFPFSVHGRFDLELRVLEGCLALVSGPNRMGVLDVWLMRQYGVRDSWTKFIVICPDWSRAGYNVVCDLNEDEIVVEKDFEKLFAYNRKNGAWRDLAVAGIPEDLYRVRSFRGSLLSPD